MPKMMFAFAVLGLACGLGEVGSASAAPISVGLYSTYSDNGTNMITVTGSPYETYSVDSIMSETDPNFPPNTAIFAAIYDTSIDVSSSGSYMFNLASDDASYLYIDGNYVGGVPGAHSYQGTSITTSLSEGVHTLQLQYDNQYSGGDQVDLVLPSGVSYTTSTVPLPATLPLFGVAVCGLGLVGYGMRRRNAKGAA